MTTEGVSVCRSAVCFFPSPSFSLRGIGHVTTLREFSTLVQFALIALIVALPVWLLTGGGGNDGPEIALAFSTSSKIEKFT